MPHSSGGGSHGGGSYSGSSSSSGRSSSSSSRSFSNDSYSSGSSGGRRYSRDGYYPRNVRYVYYDFRNRYHEFRMDGYPDKPDRHGMIVGCIFWSIILVPLILALCWFSLYIPKPLELNSYKHEIVIKDSLQTMDARGLKQSFMEFQKLTGVTPALEVVCDAEWDENYVDLETYAYSEYLRLFEDEKHWLFVISYPEDYKTTDFERWQWAGMIGDETGQVISEQTEEKSVEIIHKHLLRSDYQSVDQAMIKSLEEISKTVMDRQLSSGLIITAFAVLVIYAIVMWITINYYKTCLRNNQAVAVSENAPEKTCPNCGLVYIKGSIRKCPACGHHLN